MTGGIFTPCSLVKAGVGLLPFPQGRGKWGAVSPELYEWLLGPKTFLGQNSCLVLKMDLYVFNTGEKIHTITGFLK